MNPKEEQDLRAEIADAVEDKCLYVIRVGIKNVNLIEESECYVSMGR